MNNVIDFLGAGGLNALKDSLIGNYIGPAFIIAIAAIALIFLKKRQIMEFASFALIAVFVGVMIYGGEAIFGSGGTATEAAKKFGEQIGMIFPFFL